MHNIKEVNNDLDLICSALPSGVAKEVEGDCAKHMPVISTTSAFRYEKDVPILITVVDADHYKLLGFQEKRGWNGWIAPGPNCTTDGLVMSLVPLYKEQGKLEPERMDYLEFIAKVTSHIPDKGQVMYYLMEPTAMKIAFINVERACFKDFSRASTVIFVSSTSFFSIASRTPGSILAE